MRVAAYEQSFFVDMFNGAQAVRVAEVYDQFWAERLSMACRRRILCIRKC